MTVTPSATYLPRPRRQLDGTRYAGGACGDIMTRNAIDWSTYGAVSVGALENREAMGTWVGQAAHPPTDATALSDQQRAWGTYRDDARRKGLRLGAFTRRLMVPWEEVIEALDAGYAVGLQYSYDVINTRCPALSGDPRFMGLHIALITRVRRRSSVELLVMDGLYDGRRKGIPKGPQWIKAWILREAAERKVFRALMDDPTFMAGKKEDARREEAKKRSAGVAVFAVIARSTLARPDPEPVPDPDPDATCAQQLALVRGELASVREQLQVAHLGEAAAEGRIRTLELALGTARTALQAWATAADETTAALEDIDALLVPDPDDGSEPTEGVGPDKP